MFASSAAGVDRSIPDEPGSFSDAPNILLIVPEPGADTPRTLVATVRDNCTANPIRCAIHSLDLDVIGMS